MLDFKTLEAALAPISEMGQGEKTILVNGNTSITLRLLTQEEDLLVQRFASENLNSKEEEGTTTYQNNVDGIDYIDRYRLAVLSYSIVTVGGLDFRGVDYVETGDRLQNGKPVKITKAAALQKLLRPWSRSLLIRVFQAFSDLNYEVQQRVAQHVVFEPADRDTEILRLQEMLETLKTAKKESEDSLKTQFSRQVEAIAEIDNPSPPEQGNPPSPEPVEPVENFIRANPNEVDEDLEEAAPPPRRVMPRQPIVPTRAEPPVAPPVHKAQTQQPRPVAPKPSGLSSFLGDDDTDAAMAQEHERLVAMRQRNMMGLPSVDEGSGLDRLHPQRLAARRPPHADAYEVEGDVDLVGQRLTHLRQIGEASDGHPVFGAPPQHLESSQARPAINPNALNPQTASGVPTNPRFVTRKT